MIKTIWRRIRAWFRRERWGTWAVVYKPARNETLILEHSFTGSRSEACHVAIERIVNYCVRSGTLDQGPVAVQYTVLPAKELDDFLTWDKHNNLLPEQRPN